jgi:hypothetical protein
VPQAWGNQAFKHQEFWGLLFRHGLQYSSEVVLQAWGTKLLGRGYPEVYLLA